MARPLNSMETKLGLGRPSNWPISRIMKTEWYRKPVIVCWSATYGLTGSCSLYSSQYSKNRRDDSAVILFEPTFCCLSSLLMQRSLALFVWQSLKTWIAKLAEYNGQVHIMGKRCTKAALEVLHKDTSIWHIVEPAKKLARRYIPT